MRRLVLLGAGLLASSLAVVGVTVAQAATTPSRSALAIARRRWRPPTAGPSDRHRHHRRLGRRRRARLRRPQPGRTGRRPRR